MKEQEDKKPKKEASQAGSGQPTEESVDWEAVAKRALADLDNYKKQQEKARGEMTQFMSLSLMHKFLGVYDDLSRMLEIAKGSKTDAVIVEGIGNILKKFGEIFKAEGLEQINVKPGDQFDPNVMEAISHEEHDQYKEDSVIEQFESGLMYKDKVIKPARVRVGK